MLYQRVEYRIKLCENSDEEYRHFRDAMREHVWFRQQLIDVGIESVSEYRPPVKKSDGDKPTASPDNTKPEASEDAAKRYVTRLLQSPNSAIPSAILDLGRGRATSSKKW